MQLSLPAEWNDLPQISVRTAPLLDGLEQCAIAEDGNDIRQCWIRAGGQAALVFLIRDDVMPLVWVNFSTSEPRDGLLIAVARTLVAHHLACVEGRDF